MEPTVLLEWIEDHGYTVSSLARALDVDRRTVQRYLNGQIPIPRTVELALKALEK